MAEIDGRTRSSLLSPIEATQIVGRVYGRFALRFAEDPSISALVELADSLTGHPIVVTDGDGSVLYASRGVDDGWSLIPPPLPDVSAAPARCGTSWCATSTTRPGAVYAWVLDSAANEDLATLQVVALTAEYASILDRAVVSLIPERWRFRSRLGRAMVTSAPDGQVVAMAAEIDHDLDRAHHVVAIEPMPGFDAQRFTMSAGSRLHEFGLVTSVDDRAVIVVGNASRLHPLIDTLSGMHDLGAFRAGVSSSSPDGIDLSRALAQANAACDDASMGGDENIVWHDEADFVLLLTRLADDESIREYIDTALGPLLEYEGPHRDEFLETLRVWIDSTESLDAVARSLNIHRSTLTYRIRRIRELLGHDVRDPDQRFRIGLALRMMQQLNGR